MQVGNGEPPVALATVQVKSTVPLYPYISLSSYDRFRRRFWVESGGSLQYGVAREATNMNVVPLDQLLPYSSRRVSVAFAYADNRGEHANRAKSRQRSVQGLRPEGAEQFGHL